MKKNEGELKLKCLVIDGEGYFFGLDNPGQLWKYDRLKSEWYMLPMKKRNIQTCTKCGSKKEI